MGTITTTTAAVFIPEIWEDEIRAAYETFLIVGKRVKNFNHKGKPGDVLHVPDISNLVVTDMVAGGEVVAQSVTESEFTLTINKWKDSSFRVSDIVKAQSKYDLRTEYTKKTGYAIAKQIETDLMGLFANSAVQGYNGDGTTEASGGAAVTLAGLLTAQQYLLSNDVPFTDLTMVIPPSARTVLMQVSAFTSIDYVNKKPVETGKIGEILGMDVYVSNLCPSYTVSTAKINAIVFHKDSLALALQISPRTQAAYELSKKSWLVSTDTVYGCSRFRATNAVRLRMNVTS